MGNALRFARQHLDKVRYCHPWRKWLVWNGRYWKIDASGAVMALAKQTVKTIYTEASEARDADRRSDLAKHALKSEDVRRIQAMVTLAQSEPGIPVQPAELDSDPWTLNVLNGTLDLRTGELREHEPADLITKIAPVKYEPDAVCPLWLRFQERIMDGNQALIDYKQRAIGYSLTGLTVEQCLYFAHGTGANGKSVELELYQSALGDYALQAVSELLMVKHGESHPTERADLFGKRLVCTIETEEGKRLNESLMKQLTGSDRIRARRMREDFWEFVPTHKLWLAANHKPVIRGQDYAVWRRIRLVPYTVTIPPEERDKHLAEKLKAELPGIFAWMVRGCLEWQRIGLAEPPEVKAASDQYRDEMDLIAQFVDERCVVGSHYACTAGNLYAEFRRWAEAGGERVMPQRAFGQQIGKRYERYTNNGTWYRGVALRHDEPPLTEVM
ncbi:MAG: phage/plasmid primase, P4 family [Gemmataceae bacterium]